MDATTSKPAQTALATAESAKRFLDPFAEWRDCANQWDVTEVWRKPSAVPSADPDERVATAPPATG
jgi:hypothetical protein